MNSAKIDGQLNFARELPMEVLDKDLDIKTGYDSSKNTWELIVKYSGDISEIAMGMDIIIEDLSYGYAIVIIRENLIDKFSMQPGIVYIEKPRRLYFDVEEAKSVSCIDSVQRNAVSGLYGEGVLVAIIDSGIDYRHPEFRVEDGSTRIIRLWDQTLDEGTPPKGYIFGSEYTRQQIDTALKYFDMGEIERGYSVVPSVDTSGHGTHVTGIACGNIGVASRSEIVVVKLGDSIGDSFPRTSRLLEALNYVMNIAIELRKPVAINLSFGNNYGDHSGRSILEQYIDNIAANWKCAVCVGVGNEGRSRKHIGCTKEGGCEQILRRERNILEYVHELVIGQNQNYVSMQIWKNFKDEIDISIVAPSGERIIILRDYNTTSQYIVGETQVYVYYGEPTPYNMMQEINIIFYPQNNYLESGIWNIILTTQKELYGRYDIWLGATTELSDDTGFVESDAYGTLTIPSTSFRAISVAAYDGRYGSYATFSGRGFRDYTYIGKPDIAAPGVDIVAAATGGGYESRTGTSMATPIVTGSAALMLEWGITRGYDPYLYGEKLKAFLIRGARAIDQFKSYPNPEVGWGALCLKDSLDIFR